MALIPMVVGLVAAGAVAFAFGGKGAKAAQPAAKPPTHRPKRKAPGVSDTSERAIKAAMNNPAAMKVIIDQVNKTGDPSKLWNLGRTILLNSQGKPTMQAVAAQVLANAVVMAAKKGDLGTLVATALANGDAAILAGAAKSAIALNPALSSQLNALIDQLSRSAKPPAQSPGQPRAPVTRDEQLDTKAAQAATQVLADAIRQTEQIAKQPASAPIPEVSPSPVTTTLPEMTIEASPQVLSPQQTAAMQLTEYLQKLTAPFKYPHEARFKEDKSKVGQAQSKMGITADGKYGKGTAGAIAALGIVPIPPFYWSSKTPIATQKNAYKAHIAEMAGKFSDLNWSPALLGVDRS